MTDWKTIFSKAKPIPIPGLGTSARDQVASLGSLKARLDRVHIPYCLVKPFFEKNTYPLVESRELLPSFEADVTEYNDLPGFSLVAFARSLDYFHEIFQFDMLHACIEPNVPPSLACPLVESVMANNNQAVLSRLPRSFHEPFKQNFNGRDLTDLTLYPEVLPYLLQMDRGHVMALDSEHQYSLSGVYASFPSDLDTELKRFGLKHGKFSVDDNVKYEINRPFVYQFLMELYGFPIVSERRTSAALFSRRLFRLGENFLIRVLGQSDRTLTTLSVHPKAKFYPLVEKIALVRVDSTQKEVLEPLRRRGFFLDYERRAVILRVVYRQHKYDPNNVREDRALSVVRQEIIHPLTGRICDTMNIIKDISTMSLKLNDIVRGEYAGKIRFKRQEIVENTDSHEKRLKFLHSWLSKHQRRIIGYSDDFYAIVVKVLDGYLLNPDLYDEFNAMHDLHQEVWTKYSYIRQARQVQELEDIKNHLHRGQPISAMQTLELACEIMGVLRFEIVNYFEDLVGRALYLCSRILNDSYIKRTYLSPKKEQLTPYGQKVRSLYGRLVSLVDEVQSVRKTKKDGEDAGVGLI